MHTALVPKAPRTEIAAVDQFAREARSEIAKCQQAGSSIEEALLTARATQGLRELITDAMMSDMMALMNSQLGFETDRDPSRPGKQGPVTPYGVAVVKDCFIVSQLWGARPVNLEWGIMSGRCYRKVNFYRRRIFEVPGVTAVHYQIGDPVASGDKKALVSAVCRWVQHGKPCSRVCDKTQQGDFRIAVRVNFGMGDDALKAKAERRLLAMALADMEGRSLTEADLDPTEDPTILEGHVLESTVTDTTQLENPGDDIAADAAQALADQTPPVEQAPPVERPKLDKSRALEAMRKKPRKSIGAWVAHCASQGVDISAEADEYLKSA